jgi:hypothetical protein
LPPQGLTALLESKEKPMSHSVILVPGLKTRVNFTPVDLIVGSPNFLKATADMASATWNTAAAHRIATVTGIVLATVLPYCVTTLTDAADTATIALGVTGSPSALIAATGAAGSGGTTIDAGEFWVDATPAELVATTAQMDALTIMIPNSRNIGYTIGTAALTGGKLDFYIWWTPISTDGMLVAGAGGAL